MSHVRTMVELSAGVVPAAASLNAGLQLVAQVLDPGISALVGNVGIVAILIWHLWYHTTHSYPQMLAKFSEETERMRQAFQAEQNASRNHHENQSEELRGMLIQTLKDMRTAVHDVRDTAQTVMSRQAAAHELERRDRQ